MTPDAKRCTICGSAAVEAVIDFGCQPLCNRFTQSPGTDEGSAPLSLGVCTTCGTVQLLEVMPADTLRPRVTWITCNEPEGHLDDLASHIAGLPGLHPASTICGVSFKDDSTLARLRKLGYHNTRRLEPTADLDIIDARAGIETIQERLTPARAEAFVQRHDAADVVIARHVWEHTGDPLGFATALKRMVKPNGYVVLEVPDCEKAFAVCDYTTVWEEHPIYFTTNTFHRALSTAGFSPVRFMTMPYVLENSLIAIVRPTTDTQRVNEDAGAIDAEHARIRHFAEHFPARKARVREYLQSLVEQKRRIAMFGAGHLACTFISLFEVAECIDCIIDDNPHKIGLYMPACRRPIEPSLALLDRDISLCLLSINAGGSQAVIDKHRPFINRGGTFRSIFPASDIPLEA